MDNYSRQQLPLTNDFLTNVDHDGQLVDLDLLRSKLASANLRISGQLQTIRSLEVQLGEAILSLKQSETVVSESKLRIQALERREKNSYLRGNTHEETTDKVTASGGTSDRAYNQARGIYIPQQILERDAIRKLKVG